MAAIAIKTTENPYPKIIQCDVVDGEHEQDCVRRHLLRYYKENPDIQMYRVITRPDGTFVLRPLQAREGTIQTTTRVTDADFEDTP